MLTAARTNWNFEFARTVIKILSTKFLKRLKKCQRLLSTFANLCYFFIINEFINVYYYFWTISVNTCIQEIQASMDMDISMDKHVKSVDMEFHVISAASLVLMQSWLPRTPTTRCFSCYFFRVNVPRTKEKKINRIELIGRVHGACTIQCAHYVGASWLSNRRSVSTK